MTRLEDILYRVLGAHGETYPGALADRDALGAPSGLTPAEVRSLVTTGAPPAGDTGPAAPAEDAADDSEK